MNSKPTKAHAIEQLRERLLIAPFHRWLNLGIVELNASELVLEMPWRDEIVSNPAISSAHGGILSSLIDLTGLYAILAFGGAVRATADLHVDFHRPATPGPLRAIGEPVKIGRQVSVARVRVVNIDGVLLASGRGAYIGA